MRQTLIALAVGLTTLTALPAAATDLSVQTRPGAERQDNRGNPGRDNDRNDRNQASSDRYGRWDSSWGSRPPAPPRHYTRTADWNRHVRACQQRFRSYDVRTDRYVPRRGQTALCRL
ncbi:BA14K family protein [Brevundimonas subvibrioides]|uniref:BA14K family protein n=1 Tax=Brevundimonas subvibrioides TaxID=74313 RepID=UPI0032D5903E